VEAEFNRLGVGNRDSHVFQCCLEDSFRISMNLITYFKTALAVPGDPAVVGTCCLAEESVVSGFFRQDPGFD
jgi:hypothetical protein